MIMWALSDRAIPRSYRMMEGFGVHTFRFVNAAGKGRFVKFHWKPLLGVHSLVWDEAQQLAGKDHNLRPAPLPCSKYCFTALEQAPASLNQAADGVAFPNGMVVTPGDLMLGDGDGVVCVPRERVEEVYAAALAKHQKDEEDARAVTERKVKRDWVDATLRRLGCEFEKDRS